MGFTVAVLGAAGGIGQPLSLLLKNSPYVEKLVLFDVVPAVKGVGVDLSHIETPAEIITVVGDMKDKDIQKQRLAEALKGVEVAVIPAGIPRKPGMSRDDLFNINAGIVKGLVEGIAETCPDCMICMISNPVNSTVPIAAEVMKKVGKFDPKKLFGVSTLDIVRANTFVAQAIGQNPADVNVTVVGGHSGETILPLLSEYKGQLGEEKIKALTDRIQNAGTEVVDAKEGAGSATLSMAYAGARFAISVMKAMSGAEGVEECAYVATNVMPGVEYFAAKVTLGKNGVEKIHDVSMDKLSPYEKELMETKVIPQLQKNIEKGIEFVK